MRKNAKFVAIGVHFPCRLAGNAGGVMAGVGFGQGRLVKRQKRLHFRGDPFHAGFKRAFPSVAVYAFKGLLIPAIRIVRIQFLQLANVCF